MKNLALILALVLAPFPAAADDAVEIARTWAGALAYAPGAVGPELMEAPALMQWLAANPATPVVVYGHGCDGFSKITRDTGRWLAGEGFAFVAPDSFSRVDKPKSCDAPTNRGGLHRGVLAWRQAEIGNAIARVALATDAPIALMGHSEGAITAATYTGEPVAARVIEGWTCHAGWPEYRGLNAPTAEPVLSLVGAQDPWFSAPSAWGDCGRHMDGNDRSIVFRKPGYLHKKHWLSGDRNTRKTIVAFLREHLPLP